MEKLLTTGRVICHGRSVADCGCIARRYGFCAAATVVFLLTGLPQHVKADGEVEQVELDQILQQWSTQSEKIRSARFTWDESQVVPKGGLHDPKHSPMPLPQLPKDRCLPAEDHHSSGVGTLLLAGEMIRFDVTEHVFSVSENRFRQRRYTSSFNGETNRVLRAPEGAAKQGTVSPKDAKQEWESIRLRPLMLALRAADPEFSRIPIESLEVLQTPGFVRGRKCIRLRVPLPRGRQELYYVDPDRAFCVVRYTTELYGKLQSEVEVEYTNDAKDDLWVPSSWTVQVHRYPDGFVEHVYTGTVTEYAINEPLGKEAFNVTFPEHTVVADMRGRGQPTTYIETGRRSGLWQYWVACGALVLISLLFAHRILRRRRT